MIILDWVRDLLRRIIRAFLAPFATNANRQQQDVVSNKVSLGNISQFEAGKLTKVDANGTSVLVTVMGDNVCAVRNQCAHLPVPLEGGKIEGDTIICPFHTSRFDLCSGENRDWVTGLGGVTMPGWSRRLIAMGQSPKDIRAYTVTVEGDEAFIELV